MKGKNDPIGLAGCCWAAKVIKKRRKVLRETAGSKKGKLRLKLPI